MKEQKVKNRTNFVKKLFIKICRFLGYEIIDQSNFSVPTQKKYLNENLNVAGKKSITLPLGEVKISREVKSLCVIFRSCSSVNMLTQNKRRLFDKDKSHYTLRSLNSILSSLKEVKVNFPNVNLEIIIVDHNSENKIIDRIKKNISSLGIKNTFISLEISKFVNQIKKINEENKNVTDNQISNMSNIHQSLLLAKQRCKDLVYFVEDDYLHSKETFCEMISTYERLSSQLKKELILCPADYPYLYTKTDTTNIFLGSKRHWRRVEETLCTFLTSINIVDKYWDKLLSMCLFEHYPFEKPLHNIYKTEICLSPMPSLAFHCTNINSVYGLSPNIDWKKIWDENESFNS